MKKFIELKTSGDDGRFFLCIDCIQGFGEKDGRVFVNLSYEQKALFILDSIEEIIKKINEVDA